jgi:hypothetical protein
MMILVCEDQYSTCLKWSGVMVFVNEYITPQDVLRFDMQQDWELIQQPIIERPDGKKERFTGTFSNLILDEILLASTNDADSKKRPSMQHFAIDRVQEIYLRRGGFGREAWGDLGVTYYLLYIKGYRIYFSVLYEGNLKLSDPENKISAYTLFLKQIVIPEGLEVSRDSILLLIKDAIQVFGESGIRSKYHYIFNFQF